MTFRKFSILNLCQTKTKIESGLCVVVDVRDKREYLKSHIRMANSIPLQKLMKCNLSDINPNEKEWILIHCQLSLIRGPQAALYVDSLVKGTGFKIGLIQGGLKAFEQEFEDLIKRDPHG